MWSKEEQGGGEDTRRPLPCEGRTSQGDWSRIWERVEAREVMCMRQEDFNDLFIGGFK